MVTETLTLDDIQQDSQGMLDVLAALGSRLNSRQGRDMVGADDVYALSELDLVNLFKSSNIIRRIITRYPAEAKSLGYQLKSGDGEVQNENDDILLSAFEDASAYSRLFAHCYLCFVFEDEDDNTPMIPGAKLTDYKILFDLKKKGDFYHEKDDEKIRYHKTKIDEWKGHKSYEKKDKNFSVSVLQGLYRTYVNYISSNDLARDILLNISYLTIGIKGLAGKIRTQSGRDEVFSRLLSVNENRSVEKLLAHDLDTEKIEFISQTLSGIREVISELKDVFVADCDYPHDILFEDSPKNSMGSGTQNQLVQRFLWAKRTHTWTKNHWLKHYQDFFALWQPGSELKVEIPFRFEMTPMEQAELETKAAERTSKLVSANVITGEEARAGYQGEEFTINIVLDEAAYKKANLSPDPQPKNETKEGQTIKETPQRNPQKDSAVLEILEDMHIHIHNETPQQKDAEVSDKEWDKLATITEEELVKIAEEIVRNKKQQDSTDLFLKAEDLEVLNLPFDTKIFEIERLNYPYLYTTKFKSEEDAESAYLESYPEDLEEYNGVLDVTHTLFTLLNTDCEIQTDAKVKGNLCRGANGRFISCGSGGAGGGSEPSKKTKTTAPKTINSKTNIAQLKAIAKAEGVKLPEKGLNRRQTYIDAIQDKVGDKYKPGKKSATKTEKPEAKKEKKKKELEPTKPEQVTETLAFRSTTKNTEINKSLQGWKKDHETIALVIERNELKERIGFYERERQEILDSGKTGGLKEVEERLKVDKKEVEKIERKIPNDSPYLGITDNSRITDNYSIGNGNDGIASKNFTKAQKLGVYDNKGNLQATAVYSINRPLPDFDDGTTPHVYIDLLASAPWNMAKTDKTVKGAGTKAIIEAVKLSEKEGLEGRVILQPLEGAKGFYEKLGFKELPGTFGNWELTPAKAKELLKKAG